MNKVINGNITIYLQDLRLKRDIGAPYVVKPGTTLNEVLNINKDSYIAKEYPLLQYFAIGTGGVKVVDGTSFSLSPHSAKDVQPFEMIPFIIREPDNDILPEMRSKYKFKKDITIDGKHYIAYYLKLIEDVISKDEFYKISTDDNGRSQLSYFNTNVKEVTYPIPIDREEMLQHPERHTLIVKTNKILFSLNVDELKELNNVMTILGKGTRLTELALCTGIAGSTAYDEPSKVQSAYFASCSIDVQLRLKESYPVKLYIEVGSNEPYL